jgi:hypothetical protein
MEKNLSLKTYAHIPLVSGKNRQIILIFFGRKKVGIEKTFGK